MAVPRALLVLAWCLTATLYAIPADGDSSKLRRELDDLDVSANWIYDDLDYARQLARKNGKPLFVTFRCVPCDACKIFDARVRKNPKEIKDLLDQFVCVRLIQMKGVDLDIFQFDFDMSWSAFFMNADNTVYGRYGTRAPHDAMAYNSMASLKRAMRGALKIHRRYPGNKRALHGKQAGPGRWRRPEDIPLLHDRRNKPTTPETCIHCHMVYDAMREAAYDEGSFDMESIWVYPLPDNVGMVMDVDAATRIEKVTPGSFADRAGLRSGDELISLDGQPLLSQADIQWVLHHAPTKANIPVVVERKGKTVKTRLSFKGAWKRADLSWRASLFSLRPKHGFWAPELSQAEKRELELAPDALALRVKWIPDWSTAHAAGLRNGDVIIGVDGRSERMTPPQLAVYVRLEHQVGDQLKLTVLRGDRSLELLQKLK